MIRSILLTIWFCGWVVLQGQTLRVTFSASGASDKVDSVKATNLRTNKSVRLPGNDTLILNYIAGIPVISDNGNGCAVYPNPSHGKATFTAHVIQPEIVLVSVYRLTGQLVAQTEAAVQPGSCRFILSLSAPGVYLVSMTNDHVSLSCKVVCAETGEPASRICYAGTGQPINPGTSLKASSVYSLDYSTGDIILYRCRGGIHTTIITDSPLISKNYSVEFAPCIDPSGKSYAIVKIGAQTWMAENLAWLPVVNKSDTGSEFLRLYYVYGNEDTVVSAVKNTLNYKTYGVLYNWPAAMNAASKTASARGACPEGWHVPLDDEWKILEMSLGMTQADADTVNWRTSGSAGEKIKSTTGWFKDTLATNFSGFTALPGGYRNTHGGYREIGKYALFWSATQPDTSAWYRSAGTDMAGTYRLTTLQSPGFSVRCIKDN